MNNRKSPLIVESSLNSDIRRGRATSRNRTASESSKQLTFDKKAKMNNRTSSLGSVSWVVISAIFYVISGVSQPILMAYAKYAGLADPGCQLYMLFYYLGPAAVAITLRRRGKQTLQNEYATKKSEKALDDYGATSIIDIQEDVDNSPTADDRIWPNHDEIKFASAIALWDILAQSMVYAGNNLAGPTIFSIIYSSVTVWAAIFSKILLSRNINNKQWIGVLLVVTGLSVTAIDSLSHGEHVFVGSILILIGSSFHALTYVLSEMVMTFSSIPPQSDELFAILAPSEQNQLQPGSGLSKSLFGKKLAPISVRANCAIQGVVACLVFLIWQLCYTLPRFQSLILDAMNDAGTSVLHALVILTTISLANLLHSVTFYQTLKDFPGGATSAGILKGLQAVLVFLLSSIVLCGRIGGLEMRWTQTKFLSLIVVVFGILLYGLSTPSQRQADTNGIQLLVSAEGTCQMPRHHR